MLDPSDFGEAAGRIIDQDGAHGVAMIMVDHHRLLQVLREVYDRTSEGPHGGCGQGTPRERLTDIRQLALNGLKLPADLKRRLIATGSMPAATEGEEVNTEESAEAAARRLAGELLASDEKLGEALARVDALEEEARRFVAAMTEFGDTPWWLRAAASFNELSRLAVDREGA